MQIARLIGLTHVSDGEAATASPSASLPPILPSLLYTASSARPAGQFIIVRVYLCCILIMSQRWKCAMSNRERERGGKRRGRGQRGCAPRCSPYLRLIINKANRNCFSFDFFAKGIRTVDQRNDPSISLESIRLWVIDTPPSLSPLHLSVCYDCRV